MKKTRIKELFKNIGKSFSSFISIVLFIFFGISIFQGTSFGGEAIQNSLSKAYIAQNAYDLKVPYMLGISQDEVDSLRNIEGVDKAEGYFTAYEYFENDTGKFLANISSITKEIDTLDLTEGRMPENDNEILCLATRHNYPNVKLGDKITFSGGNGPVNYLISKLRDVDDFSVIETAKETYENFNNSEFIVTGFARNPQYYSDSRISYGVLPTDSSQVDIVFFANYSAFNPAVTNGYFNNVILKNNDLAKLDTFSDTYKNKCEKLSEKVESDVIKIANNRFLEIKEIVDNFDQLKIQLSVEALSCLDSGLISQNEYDNLNAFVEQTDKYLNKFYSLDSTTVYVRRQNAAYLFCSLISESLINIRYILGGLFLFIALLITFSVISRLVNNDLKRIGTKKALGFTTKEITRYYLSYTLFACLIGAVLGNVASIFFGNLLMGAVTNYFGFVKLFNYFNFKLCGILGGSVFLAVTLITIIGCISSTNKAAVDLLKGDEISMNGKRFHIKGRLFDKTSLFTKTIINNSINDRRRVIATIIGIASSVAMIVGCITMKQNVGKSFTLQFGEYYRYDYLIYIDAQNKDSVSNVMSYLDENDIVGTAISKELVSFSIDGNENLSGFAIVYEPSESFDQLMNVESATDEEFNHTGIWVQESFMKEFDCDDFSRIDLNSSTGRNCTANIEGYFKHYTYNAVVYLDTATYKNIFGASPDINAIACDLTGRDIEKIANDLEGIEGYQSLFDFYTYNVLDLEVFNQVADALVMLYLVVAVLMSVFVILNLLLTFVSEKKIELITMMVNGYSFKDACRYIYSDTIFLTIIGILIGNGLGIVAGDLSVSAFESLYLSMPHGVDPIAILIGTGFTIVLVTIMSIISLQKIKSFKLKDINTSVQ